MRHAVARLDDLRSGAMKLVHADHHRILLVRSATGVYALDNACPHQGYGLAQGDLNGGLLTCQWHNWKFRVDDGECVLGEEDVRTYPVFVEDGQVFVDIVDPTPEEQRARLLPSLRRGIADDYSGQIARDVVRLLQASTNPAELVWEGIAWGAPRGEFGWGHSLAMAADCLRLTGSFDDDQRAFPIVQALAGIAEVDHLRPPRPQPPAVRTLPLNPRSMFRALVEAQDLDGAEALMLGAIELGVTVDDVRAWCIDVVCDHHLSFGHGAI
jgi:nitrite reductase/ring-hydroxylating ferredoxin subunit